MRWLPWAVCVAVCVTLDVARASMCTLAVHADPFDYLEGPPDITAATAAVYVRAAPPCTLDHVNQVLVDAVDVTSSFSPTTSAVLAQPQAVDWPLSGLAVFANATLDGQVVVWEATVVPGPTLFNALAGTVGLDVTAPTGENANSRAVEMGDLDGDGHVDVLVGTRDTADVYFGSGAGEFNIVDGAVPGLEVFGDAVMADVSGDGLLDVLEVSWSRAPGLYIQTSGGEFSSVPSSSSGLTATLILGVAVGDVDMDGDLDVVLAGAGGDVAYRNDGGLFIDAASLWGYHIPSATSGVVHLLDFDGDTDLDVVATRYALPLVALRNTVADTGTVLFVDEGTAGMDLPAGSDVRTVITGDFDGNGAQDVYACQIVALPNALFFNNGSGGFTPAPPANGLDFTHGSDEIEAMATDFNGDGWLDVVVATPDVPLRLLLNTAAGALFVEVSEAFGMSQTFSLKDLAALDFDADGDLDMLLLGVMRDYVLRGSTTAEAQSASSRGSLAVRVVDRFGSRTTAGSTIVFSDGAGWSATRVTHHALDTVVATPDAQAAVNVTVNLVGGQVRTATVVPGDVGVVVIRDAPRVVGASVVSPASPATALIGDAVVIEVVAAALEDGLQLAPWSTVNGVALTARGATFTPTGSGRYNVEYVVARDDGDWGPGALRAALALVDPASGQASANATLAPHAVAGDTTVPALTLTCAPGPATPNPITTLCVTCSEPCTVVASTNAAPAVPTSMVTPLTTAPAFGPFVEGDTPIVALWACDALGNCGDMETATVVSWVVDMTPPVASVESAPEEFVGSSTSLVFGCSEPNCAYTYSLDGSVPTPLSATAGGITTTQSLNTAYVSGPPAVSNTLDLLPPLVFNASFTGFEVTPAMLAQSTVEVRRATDVAWLPLLQSSVAVAPDGTIVAVAALPVEDLLALPTGNDTGVVSATVLARAMAGTGARDPAPIAVPVAVDNQAPVVSIVMAPSGVVAPLSVAQVVVEASEEATFRFRVGVGTPPVFRDAVTTASVVLDVDGVVGGETWTVEVVATDGAGNPSDTASVTWATFDCFETIPDIALGALVNDAVGNLFVSWVPDRVWNQYQWRLDGSPWTAITEAHVLVRGITSDASHVFEVRAAIWEGCEGTAPAGRPAPKAYAFQQVGEPPAAVRFVDAPPATTTSLFADFELQASAPARLECALDGEPFSPCVESLALGPLASGVHTLDVRAAAEGETAAGAVAAHTWAIDAATDSRLDLVGLSDGPHVVTVFATDWAGLVQVTPPASASFLTDTLPPVANVTRVSPRTSFAPTINFTATCTLELRPDLCTFCFEVAPFELAGLPAATPSSGCLPAGEVAGVVADVDGAHSVVVTVVDATGNAGLAVGLAWEVDTKPPETTLHTGSSPAVVPLPPHLGSAAAWLAGVSPVRLNVSASEPVQAYVVNGATLPAADFVTVALPDGVHNVTVAGVDVAGNVDPDGVGTSLFVDTRAPNTTVVNPPPAATLLTNFTTTFRGDDAGSGVEAINVTLFMTTLTNFYEGGGAWVVALSTLAPANATGFATVGFEGLRSAAYSLEAAAVDYAGNAGPAVPSVFVLDVAPPECGFDPGTTLAGAWLPTTTFNVSGVASEPVVFQARVNGGPWQASAPTFASVATFPVAADGDGAVTIELACADAAGNVSPPPATSVEAVVDTVPPTVSVVEPLPPAATSARDMVVCVEVVDAAGVSVSHAVDVGVAAGTGLPLPPDAAAIGAESGASRAVPGGLFASETCVTVAADTPGNYSLTITAMDDAGFAAAPLTYAWILDRVAPVVEPAPSGALAATSSCTTVGNTTVCDTPVVVVDVGCGEGGGAATAGPAAACVVEVAVETLVALGDACVSGRRLQSITDADWVPVAADGAVDLPSQGTFNVWGRAVDDAGNVQAEPEVLASVSVDTTPPAAVTIESAPPAQTSSTSAVFVFRFEDDSPGQGVVAYVLDGGTRTDVTDVPVAANGYLATLTLSGLGTGAHTLRAFGVDQAGLEGPSTPHAWQVGTSAPDVEFVSAPAAVTGDTAPTVVVRAVWGAGSGSGLTGGEPGAGVEYLLSVPGGGGGGDFDLACEDTVDTGGECAIPLDANQPGTYVLQARAVFLGVTGAAASANWQLQLCTASQFAVLGDDLSIVCQECPEGGICAGGTATSDTIVAGDGFWASRRVAPGEAPVFFPCNHDGVCLAGARLDNGTVSALVQCAAGHEGTLCDVCQEDHFRTFGGQCQVCAGDLGVMYGMVGLVAAGVVVAAALVVRFKSYIPVDEVKVLLSCLQILAGASTVYNIPWPAAFADLLRSTEAFLVDAIALTRVDCSQPMSYFQSTLLLFVAFKVVCVVLVVAPLVAASCHRTAQRRRRRATLAAPRVRLTRVPTLAVPKAVTVLPSSSAAAAVSFLPWAAMMQRVFLFLFVAYPGVSLRVMKMFDCVEVEGEWYLVADMRQTCFEGQWFVYAAYALGMGCLYTAGLPVAITAILWRNRLWLQDPDVLQRWGFLYQTYGRRAYLWEVCELLRKLLLSALVVLMQRGSTMQVTVAVLVSWWAHVLHGVYKPWKGVGKSLAYTLQHWALFVTTFVFLSGLLFQVDAVASRTAVSWVLVGVVAAFFVAAAVVLCVAVHARVVAARGRHAPVKAVGDKADPVVESKAGAGVVGVTLQRNPMFERSVAPPGTTRR